MLVDRHKQALLELNVPLLQVLQTSVLELVEGDPLSGAGVALDRFCLLPLACPGSVPLPFLCLP